MAFYLMQATYKDTAAKSLVLRPQARECKLRPPCKLIGDLV